TLRHPPISTLFLYTTLFRSRQLFAAGCIQSAYWHRFAATAHSPIGLHPEEYGITLRPPRNVTFARNDIEFDDPVGTGCRPIGERSEEHTSELQSRGHPVCRL